MLATLFVTAALALLTSAIPEKRAGARVVSHCTVPNTAALTFDDGPFNFIYDISKTLKDAGAKGTFFFNGNNMGCIYDGANVDRVRHVYNEGHQVASHTWRHADLTTLSWDQVHDEMWRVEQALERIVGVTPAFMRPPYGNHNDLVRRASGIRGQTIAIWDLDTQDSLGASADKSKAFYDEAASRRPSTILALNHETLSTTAYDVLPYAIRKLQDAGYNLVTLAECLGMEPYQKVGDPEQPNGDWHC